MLREMLEKILKTRKRKDIPTENVGIKDYVKIKLIKDGIIIKEIED